MNLSDEVCIQFIEWENYGDYKKRIQEHKALEK